MPPKNKSLKIKSSSSSTHKKSLSKPKKTNTLSKKKTSTNNKTTPHKKPSDHTHTCPIPNCSFTSSNTRSNPPISICIHIETQHDLSEISAIGPIPFSDRLLHKCHICHIKIYTRQCDLKKHLNSAHQFNRTATNSTLLLNKFNPPSPTHWISSLKWLYNLDLTPPPF
jgi:hypothetical protein